MCWCAWCCFVHHQFEPSRSWLSTRGLNISMVSCYASLSVSIRSRSVRSGMTMMMPKTVSSFFITVKRWILLLVRASCSIPTWRPRLWLPYQKIFRCRSLNWPLLHRIRSCVVMLYPLPGGHWDWLTVRIWWRSLFCVG